MTRSYICAALLGLLLSPLWANPAPSQPSNRQAIARTQQQLQRMDKLIEQNIDEQAAQMSDLLAQLTSLLPGTDNPLVSSVQKVIHLAKVGQSVGNAQYAEALENSAEAIAQVWGKTNVWVSAGDKSINIGATVYRLQTIVNEQARYTDIRWRMWDSVLKMEGKSPSNLAWWNRTLHNLRGDPAIEHTAFEHWLQQNNVSKKDVLGPVFKEAPKAARIVDSQDLSAVEAMPGINPDFITALKRQNELIARLQRGENVGPQLMMVNKYADGSYINIMGPRRVLPKAGDAPLGDSPVLWYTPGHPDIVIHWRGDKEYRGYRGERENVMVYWKSSSDSGFGSLRQGENRTGLSYPGEYTLSFGEGFEEPFKVAVRKGQIAHLAPPFGSANLDWHGSTEQVALINKGATGVSGVLLSPGRPSIVRIAPGDYKLVVRYNDMPNRRDMYGYYSVHVRKAQATKLSIPSGSVTLTWNPRLDVDAGSVRCSLRWVASILETPVSVPDPRMWAVCPKNGSVELKEVLPGRYRVEGELGFSGKSAFEPYEITIGDSGTTQIRLP